MAATPALPAAGSAGKPVIGTPVALPALPRGKADSAGKAYNERSRMWRQLAHRAQRRHIQGS